MTVEFRRRYTHSKIECLSAKVGALNVSTIVLQGGLQPVRGIAFTIGFLVTISMAFQVLMASFFAW